MSGGSFNYVEFKIESEDVFKALPDLRDMEVYLRSIGKADAANELYAYILKIETCQRYLNRHGKHLSDLIHAAEWTASSDTGPESIDYAYNKLIGVDTP